MASFTGTPKITVVGSDHAHTLEMNRTCRSITFEYTVRSFDEVQRQVLEGRPPDACEFSLANYVVLRDRGWTSGQAIPVFPLRGFRHASVYVRSDSALESLSDLSGRRLAVAEYVSTGVVWLRGILNEHYGVHWSNIRWYSSDEHFPVPKGVAHARLAQNPVTALLAGDVDAIQASRRPKLPENEGSPGVLRRLLRDPHQAERDYLLSTGIYPIAHVVVLRSNLLAEIPELAGAAFEAFVRAKRRAYERRLGDTLLPWSDLLWDTAEKLFDGDPMRYGLDARNRMIIAKLCEYLREQQLIDHETEDVGVLFVPESVVLLEDQIP